MDIYRLINSDNRNKFILSNINPSSTYIFSTFISPENKNIEVVEYECQESKYTQKYKDLIVVDCDKYEVRLNDCLLKAKGKVLLPICNMQFVKLTFTIKGDYKNEYVKYTAYTIRNDIRHNLKLQRTVETNELIVGGGRVVRYKF